LVYVFAPAAAGWNAVTQALTPALGAACVHIPGFSDDAVAVFDAPAIRQFVAAEPPVPEFDSCRFV
jgi:hypothetical protein